MIYGLLNNQLTTGLFLIGFAVSCLMFVIRCLFDQIKDTNAGGSNVGEEG